MFGYWTNLTGRIRPGLIRPGLFSILRGCHLFRRNNEIHVILHTLLHM